MCKFDPLEGTRELKKCTNGQLSSVPQACNSILINMYFVTKSVVTYNARLFNFTVKMSLIDRLLV